MRRSWVLGLVLVLGGIPGCLFIDSSHDCVGDDCGTVPGDIGFYWAFRLPEGGVTESCLQADVARMDVQVYDASGEQLEFEVLDRPCGDQGAVLTDFWPGSYWLLLSARCREGGVGYQGWFELWVASGMNELGTLALDPQGGCL